MMSRLRESMATPPREPRIIVHEVSRRFAATMALQGVSLNVDPGEIRALLGPNGAGKTTLLRILAGLTTPSAGSAHVMGHAVASGSRTMRSQIGFVPAGDRTLYMRISGLENLIFFARLYGVGLREATARAWELLEQVHLLDAARLPVGRYSHGMRKLLSVARGLLTEPPVLLLDEATLSLDPEGAQRIRHLVVRAARNGAAVLWATQRLDEIREFADTVTLLSAGQVRFSGTVGELIAEAELRTFLIRVRNTAAYGGAPWEPGLRKAIGNRGAITDDGSSQLDQYVLTLADGEVLSDAIAALSAAHFQVLTCQPVRPELEVAFLQLTREAPR